MRITKKKAKEIYKILEEEHKKIKKENKQSKNQYPYKEWERKRKKVIERLRKLPELIKKAASQIHTDHSGPGRKPKLDPEQKTTLFLYARLFQKSNRDMESIITLLGPLFNVQVSYKTIERLYSDQEVKKVLEKLFLLLLKEENTSGNCSGDGTGYSLHASQHYKNHKKKHGNKYIYAFRFLDLQTGMYLAPGYSQKSEKQAFRQAPQFIEENNIKIDKTRLDRYYSNQKNLKEIGPNIEKIVLPKKNLATFGKNWHKILNKAAKQPYNYMKDYFQREPSETYFAADKERFGRKIRQKREKRRETATFATALPLNSLKGIKIE